MKTWKEFIADISDEEWINIVNDTYSFESDGFIGISVLRNVAQEWMENINTQESVTVWMHLLSYEAFKHFTEKYLKEMYAR